MVKIKDKNSKTFKKGDIALLNLSNYKSIIYIKGEIFKDKDGFGSWKLLDYYSNIYKKGDIVDYPLHSDDILKLKKTK